MICLTVEHNCSLPPHTTHEAQPLHLSVLPPLKVQWTKVCHEFYQRNAGIIVNHFCKWLGLEELVFNSSTLSLLLTLARMCAIKDSLDLEEALLPISKALPVCNVKTAQVPSTSSSVSTHSSDSSSIPGYKHTRYGRC